MAPTKSAAKPVAKKASAHPTFLAMIQVSIVIDTLVVSKRFIERLVRHAS